MSQSPSLSDRVLTRVQQASLAADQRARASSPRVHRRRPVGPDPLSAEATRTPEQVREARALRSVFRDLGDSYRDHRRRTGEPVSSDVRQAAIRFRRELTLPSLVLVAASLDDVGALPW